MNTVWQNLKALAKRNTAVRICMIGIYAVVFTLRALWRRRLPIRKKLAACLVVFSLCCFRMFTAVAYAETAGVSGNDIVETASPEEDVTPPEEEAIQPEEEAAPPTVTENAPSDAAGGDSSEVSDNNPSDVTDNTPPDVTGNTPSDVTDNAPSDVTDNDVSDNNVSSNDVSNNDVSNNDVSDNDTPDEDVAVSENDVSNNDVSNNDVSDNDAYSYAPRLFVECRLNADPAGILAGNASSKLILSTVSSYTEPEEGSTVGSSPAVRVWEETGGETRLIELNEGKAEITFPSDFFDTVTFTAEDSMGNTSTLTTPLLLIDASAPSADIVEELQADGSKRLRAVFRENSPAASGIGETRCLVNGEEVWLPDFTIENVVENCFGRAVISEKSAPVIIRRAGIYTVTLVVKDNAGNEASYERVVDMPEGLPISMSAPSKVGMTIAPYSEGEQVYTDVCTIENKSGYDVTALLRNITLTVERTDVGGDMSKKDCDLFLSYGGAQDVALPEGTSKDFLSVVIPAKKEDGTNGTLTLRVYGKISEGSERFWRDGDIKLSMSFAYKPKEKEE